MIIQKITQGSQCIVVHQRVVVINEDVFANRVFDADVLIVAKSVSFRIPDQSYIWEFSCYHLNRSIGGDVVYDDDFKIQISGLSANGLQAIAEHFQPLMMHYRDADLRHPG